MYLLSAPASFQSGGGGAGLIGGAGELRIIIV